MDSTHEKHEHKFCPRCKAEFTCKVGDVVNCQCNITGLSEAVLRYMNETYSDCLCANCMRAMKQELRARTMQNKMNSIIGTKTTNNHE